MNRTTSICAMLVAVGTWLTVSLSSPLWLSDKNAFLKSFVGSDMLSFLGVVVTITLASTANLHLELNKMEERKGFVGFPKTRLRIKQSAYWLIGALVVALLLIVAKPWLVNGVTSEALVNGGAILLILFNVLVLVDVTQMAFSITADVPTNS